MSDTLNKQLQSDRAVLCLREKTDFQCRIRQKVENLCQVFLRPIEYEAENLHENKHGEF
jgi:hypothetical protein